MTVRLPTALGIGGIFLGSAVAAAYWAKGFHQLLPYLLATALMAVALALPGARAPTASAIAVRSDAFAVGILLLLLIPIYCLQVYTTPWQVNTDEVAFISVARGVIAEPRPDLFGLSWYFGCPTAAFFFFGKIAELLGGVDLHHVRLSQSFLGIACVVAAYALFRNFMPPLFSFLSAALLGVNHSLIAYSRMANWHGSSLFLEILALFFLAVGIQRQSRRSVFLSGVCCGVAFYFYFPGRIIIALCVFVLVLAWAIGGSERRFRPLVISASVLVLGWGIVTAPILIASAKAPPQSLQYQREQLLIYPEGRKAAQFWTNTKTPRDAWIANASNGLRAFNARIVDHGWLYDNRNHGFADPATGILLWAGFLVAASRLIRHVRRSKTESREAFTAANLGNLIALTGFLVLYFSLALLITKAPNYQRLLMILPFVAYLAATALWWIVDAIVSAAGSRLTSFGSRAIRSLAIGAAVAGILTANLVIFGDFVRKGNREGHEVGSTGRFVEARKSEAGHTWILAADKDNLYYWWGEPVWWQGWLGVFAGPNQPVRVIPPSALDTLETPRGSTVFIASVVWKKHEREFRATHGVTSVKAVLPGGRLLAVEVEGGIR